jgi:predicted enzyme related to lactoylglutathione lyase
MGSLPKLNSRKNIIFVLLLSNWIFAMAADSTSAVTGVKSRFEHIAFNVFDPIKVAKWYADNLGMKVMRSGGAPTFTTFIADSGTHMMLELFHNADFPLYEPAKIHNMSIHLAFVTPDIEKTQSQLVAAGTTVVDSLRKTSSGDKVLTLRDPWGLAIQFVQRVKPMLNSMGLYFEHFAINVDDARAKAKWYKNNLAMEIIKEGGAPSYGTFIADYGKNMMFELYQQKDYPVVDFSAVNYMSLHIAFMVDDIQEAKAKLVTAGAKVAEDVTKIPSGDFVLMMRDPWSQPIQFVKRANPMIK